MKFIYAILPISLLISIQSYAWIVNVGTQTVIKNNNNTPITISRGAGSSYANCGVRDDIVVPVGETVNISGLFKAKINGATVCTIDISDGDRNGTLEEHLSHSKYSGIGYFSWNVYGHYLNGQSYHQRIVENNNASYHTDDNRVAVVLNITSDSSHIVWITSQTVAHEE